MNYVNSFTIVTLEEFKIQYVEKNEEKPKKGINKVDINDFEKKEPIRKINNISFRVMNFILYSYLMGSYILENLTNQNIEDFSITGLMPKIYSLM